MKVENIFTVHNSNSGGFNQYEGGETAFVTNGFKNNGIVGFVKPKQKDKVFHSNGICISAFCEATVQKPPFLPRGNGGSGLTVLTPKKKTSITKLYWYATCINAEHWRFSFGRMVTTDRINNLTLLDPPKGLRIVSIKKILPETKRKKRMINKIKFSPYPIEKLFNIQKGKGKYMKDCGNGDTPLISAKGEDNGVIDFVDIEPTFKSPAITIERVGGNAFVQLEDFATVPDDLFVLTPKKELPIELLFYITMMINRQCWRFNYSRKLTPERYDKLSISLPLKKSGINISCIKKIVQNVYGWELIN